MAKFNHAGIMPYILQSCLNEFFLKKKRRALNKKLSAEVLKRYNHSCCSCNSKKQLTIDHLRPISKGGKDVLSNLQVLCRPCNSKKSDKW